MGDTDSDRRELNEEVGGEAEADDSSFVTLAGHFFRGEMDRTTSWRARLDQTTNWAVTIMAAIITWVFSSPGNPHYLLIIGMFTVEAFHVIETRRYRAYDVWRSRVRLLEENVFANVFDPRRGVVSREWREELSEDLRNPALKTPYVEAYARRLRRVYLPLLGVLLAAWVARITVFEPNQTAFETAAVVGIPGVAVVGGVAAVYAAFVAVAFWPQSRRAKGEFHEQAEYGEWKDE